MDKIDQIRKEIFTSMKILDTSMKGIKESEEYKIAQAYNQGLRDAMAIFEKEMKYNHWKKWDEHLFYHLLRHSNAYIVQVNTGLRPGELFSLRESDIDFIKKTIHVTRTLTYYKFEELGDTKKEFHFGPPKTKSSIRDIPINKQCEIALKKQILQKKVVEETTCKEVDPQFADLLFTTKYNMPLNVQTYVDSIKRIVNEINLTRFPLDYMEPFSGHTFRHTFATRCFEAGIKPKTVQKFLGHSDLSMTMNLYTHVLESFKVSQMDLLDEFNDNVLNSEESYPFKIIRGNMESGNKVSKNIVWFCG